MCESLQGNEISSDHWNNIEVKFSEGNIILNQLIKTHDSWVAKVKFLCKTGEERAQSATNFDKKDINDLNTQLAKDMGIKVTSTFKPYEDCLGKAKQ